MINVMAQYRRRKSWAMFTDIYENVVFKPCVFDLLFFLIPLAEHKEHFAKYFCLSGNTDMSTAYYLLILYLGLIQNLAECFVALWIQQHAHRILLQ